MKGGARGVRGELYRRAACTQARTETVTEFGAGLGLPQVSSYFPAAVTEGNKRNPSHKKYFLLTHLVSLIQNSSTSIIFRIRHVMRG